MVALSVLELGRVRQGADRRDALDMARKVAQRAEALGYERIWVAEHHNMPGVTTAATPVVIGHIAAGTTTIRVGAGGVMLPNHAPYVIAEQFGTLEALFPGRIDLGLGRAPGTDQLTLRALRRDPRGADHFPEDVQELRAFLGPVSPGQRIEAVPGSNSHIPLYILGSSLFGAQLAAALGLPFGFASHFAPAALDQALAIYRERFTPSAQQPPGGRRAERDDRKASCGANHLERPYTVVGVNVIAADTDEEARRLATSQQVSFANLFRGKRDLMAPPIDDIEAYWSPQERAQAGQMLACSVIGGPDTVRAGLRALLDRTRADELMIVSDVYDPDARLRSFELIAEAARGL
jgi:luciferase family oxidoreductase group 1